MRGVRLEGIDAFFLVCDLAAMSSKRPTAKTREENDDASESNNEGEDKKPNEVEKHLQKLAGYYSEQGCVYSVDFHDLSDEYVSIEEAARLADVQRGTKCPNCQQSGHSSTQCPNDHVQGMCLTMELVDECYQSSGITLSN